METSNAILTGNIWVYYEDVARYETVIFYLKEDKNGPSMESTKRPPTWYRCPPKLSCKN